MFYVNEFQRWRDAPPDQKATIASQQIAAHDVDDLFPIPDDDPARVASMPAGDGKIFADCTPDELETWNAWFHALRDAARHRCAMISLQASCGDCKL